MWLDNFVKIFGFHHSIFPRRGRLGKRRFSVSVVFSYLQWSHFVKCYPLISPKLGFFADFYSDISENLTNVYNFYYNTVVLRKEIVKTFKNCSFRTIFGQKLDQQGPCPKSSSFFLHITKGDHKLLRTFYFFKIL